MATDKTPNYTSAQEALILEAVRANGNVGNIAVATELAADTRMDASDGPRKPRGIVAKMARMAEANGFTYERKAPTTKDGKPVTKKVDLVARIAAKCGVPASKLAGMETSPKLALDTLVTALAA